MKVTISSEIAPRIKSWLNSGRGVKVWQNLEIASGVAREIFTPADHESAPNWRYGNPSVLTRDYIEVSAFQPIETFRGRAKAMYFGPWVAATTEAKAKRLCTKHSLPEDSWKWDYDPDLPGYVQVSIGREMIQSFRDWEKSQVSDNTEVLPVGGLNHE